MITDYCRGDKDDYSQDFLKYVCQRGYHLFTVPQYGLMLEKVFIYIFIKDKTT